MNGGGGQAGRRVAQALRTFRVPVDEAEVAARDARLDAGLAAPWQRRRGGHRHFVRLREAGANRGVGGKQGSQQRRRPQAHRSTSLAPSPPSPAHLDWPEDLGSDGPPPLLTWTGPKTSAVMEPPTRSMVQL